MGISGFWQFLARDCANTYDLVEGKGRDFNGDLPKIDHIFFDVNNLLYQITVTDISHFFKRLHSILDEILTLFPPAKTVYFGVDGPAPLAKLCTQIERRSERKSTQIDPKEDIDPLMFTPGTTFMALLKDDLILYCAQRISSRYPEVKFYVSGADRSGEGEAKIFQHIMHRIPTTTPRQSCLIVGNDADLILFGLRSREHADFYTLRQEPRQMKLYNSQKLGRRVMDLMGSQDSSVLDDFCVLSLFMGNDYFPKLRYYNIRQALTNFKTAKQTSPEFKIWDEEAGINFNFLEKVLVNPVTMGPNSNNSQLSNKNVPPHLLHPRTFLNHINDILGNNLIFRTEGLSSGGAQVTIYFKGNQVSEPKLDVSTGQASYHAAASLILSPRVFFDFLEQDPHLGIHLPKVKWEWGHKMKHDREYGIPPPSPSEGETELEEEEEEIAPNRGGFTRVIEAPSKELANQRYVEGIYWTMRYLTGRVTNYTYIYPYSQSPNSREFTKIKFPAPTYEVNMVHPLAPMEFLLALMPRAGLRLLPREVAARAEKDLKPLYDLASNTPELLGEWQKNMYYWLDKIRTVVQSAPRDSLTERELLQLQTQPTLRLWKGALPGAPGVYGDLFSTLTPPSPPPSASTSPAPGPPPPSGPSSPAPFRSNVHVYEMRPPLQEAYRYRFLQVFEEEEVAATSPAFVPSPLAYKPATLLKAEVQQQRFFSTSSSFGSATPSSLAGMSWVERKRPFGAVMASSPLASSWRPSGVTMTEVLKKLMKTR